MPVPKQANLLEDSNYELAQLTSLILRTAHVDSDSLRVSASLSGIILAALVIRLIPDIWFELDAITAALEEVNKENTAYSKSMHEKARSQRLN